MQMLIQSTPLPYSLVKIRTLILYFPQLQGQLPNVDIFFLQSFFKYLFLYLLKHQILTGECLLLLTSFSIQTLPRDFKNYRWVRNLPALIL